MNDPGHGHLPPGEGGRRPGEGNVARATIRPCRVFRPSTQRPPRRRVSLIRPDGHLLPQGEDKERSSRREKVSNAALPCFSGRLRSRLA